jgi:PAS domain S-box-containing protein
LSSHNSNVARMTPNTDKITSSILLDLLLALSAEEDEQLIIQKSLRLYLRKLNCFMVALYSRHGENLLLQGKLPANFDLDAVVKDFLTHQLHQLEFDRDLPVCLSGQSGHYHVFALQNYGMFVLGRQSPLEDAIVRELEKVIDNLGKSLSLAKNITLREAAEKENTVLLENLSMLRNFIQSTKDGLQVANAEGRIMFMNEEACMRIGIPEDAYTNYSVWDFEPFFSGPGSWQKHMKELKEVNELTIESYNIHLGTQAKIPVEVTVSYKEIGGNPYAIAVSRDISERKRAERMLIRREKMLSAISKASNILLGSENVYQSISNSLSIIGEAVEVDRTYLFTNHFDNNLGYVTSQRSEWNSGTSEPQIDNPDLQNIPVDLFEDSMEVMNRQLPFIRIVRQMSPTSGLRALFESQEILSVVIIPIYHEDYFWGFVGFDDCKEERIWTDAEISILQTYVSGIQNAIDREHKVNLIKSMALFPELNPDPVIRIAIDGQVILQNASAQRLDQLKINNAALSLADFFTLITEQIPYHTQELTFETEDNSGKCYKVLCKFLSEQNQINIYFSDITAQKETEKQLIDAKDKAEESDKAKEEFITNISHEMRTPLHAIIGLSGQIATSGLNPTQQEYIHYITSSGKHLQSLIDNILDFSKIASGQFTLTTSLFKIDDLVNQISDIIEPIAQSKNIDFRIVKDSSIHNVLHGDETRIRQVLLNILSNAVKFTDKGGILLETKLMQTVDSVQIVQFSIADTGIGMSEEFLVNLFDKFSQEDSSKIRRQSGTGLGMAISKELVSMMNGTITVESEKGKGTIFRVELPLEIGEALDFSTTQIESYAKLNPELQSKTVLVVEDNPINRLVVRNQLNQFGLVILEAENGLDAVNHPHLHEVDLILMDIQMPVMNGIDAAIEIRRKKGITVPIIALTANAVKTDLDRCIEVGMNDYLLKPFESHQFAEVLHRYMNLNAQTVQKSDDKVQSEDVFNLNSLIEMSGNNKDFLTEIVTLFLTNIPKDMEKMTNALKNKEYITLKGVAHKIKPSLHQFGFHSIRDSIVFLNYFDETQPEEINHVSEHLNLVTETLNEGLAGLESYLKKIKTDNGVR